MIKVDFATTHHIKPSAKVCHVKTLHPNGYVNAKILKAKYQDEGQLVRLAHNAKLYGFPSLSYDLLA
jgi:hypothetical protein